MERTYLWKWQRQNGTRTYFREFWSAINITQAHDCIWQPDTGAWRCKYCYKGTNGTRLYGVTMGGPTVMMEEGYGGYDNTMYYERLKNKDEHWPGPFSEGRPALEGHYWICGNSAYTLLPANWTGVCYVGLIWPLFFLLRGAEGNHLGVQLYNDLSRGKCSIDTSITGGSQQTWGKDKWTPQRIIQYYGPAMWNPREIFHGARELIYNLNCIIWLQAIIATVTNQTLDVLDLLAEEATQMWTAIFQHRMVLD